MPLEEHQKNALEDDVSSGYSSDAGRGHTVQTMTLTSTACIVYDQPQTTGHWNYIVS